MSAEITERTARLLALRQFSEKLRKSGVITEFDEALWGDFVDCVTVDSKKRLTFTFKDGSEITL